MMSKINPRQILEEQRRLTARRWFLGQCGVGLGSIALAELMGTSNVAAAAPASPFAAKAPHHAPTAKRVIYLFMAGAPSHLELFDYKPQLAKWEGKLPPRELLEGYRAAFIKEDAKLLGPKFKFVRRGESGVQCSELLPHIGGVVDQLTFIRSMHTEALNHAPGQIMMNTGVQQFGRPSMGAWVSYGLGSESSDLPAFVVLNTGIKGTAGGASNWGSGFLPSRYQGVPFRSAGEPITYSASPPGFDAQLQRDSIDGIRELNELKLARSGDPEIATRINSFEMAYRMQAAAPGLMDLSDEPPHLLQMYGAEPGKPSFASACLMARRLSERGVRFVQIFHEAWDHHTNLTKGLTTECGKTDRASAALVRDLKARGLLEGTLVIWGGEFGRSPMAQGGVDGRDHHPNCFTLWLAGGGMKAGYSHGESDDFGFRATRDGVHVHDLHATLLRALGLDHTKLTYRFQGREFRLTDIAGNVVTDLFA